MSNAIAIIHPITPIVPPKDIELGAAAAGADISYIIAYKIFINL
jgi:hypothetical protein